MKELTRQLKKGDGIEQNLELILQEIQSLKDENRQLHNKVDRLQESISNADVYQEKNDNYLDNKPDGQEQEFRNLLQRKNLEGADVSDISKIFGIKPRQAYNVKDRIVREEDLIAEIPKASDKNRIVSKSMFLTAMIKEHYPDLPSQIYDNTGKPLPNNDWQILFDAYANHAREVKQNDRIATVEELEDWFDYS